MRFLHTADWQIGKPFQSIEDHTKREALRKQRLDTVRELKTIIDEEAIAFVIVSGDLFDSFTPDAATVSALCSAIGHLKVPVYAIPGNHDNASPGCIWNQRFFLTEKEDLAPNLYILLDPKPVVLDQAVLLPCPLLRRHENADPTEWLRTEPDELPGDRPRIVLVHGSTHGFSSSGETDSEASINRIDLTRLPEATYDYIALGDWHGMKAITPTAWYPGTPEQDRFAKGEGNLPGYALVVETQGHLQPPRVSPVKTGKIGWHILDEFHFTNDADLETLESQLGNILDQQNNRDLLKLGVNGTLSYTGLEKYESVIERLRARLIRLNLESDLDVEPTEDELKGLIERQDPLIAQVARELYDVSETDPLNREALRELHLHLRKVDA